MIASNQPTDASQTPQLSAERVRQVHAVCLLLDTENKAVAAAMSPNERGARLAAPHGFTLAVVALAMLAVGVVATIGWWGMQPDIQRVADFRWETDYAEHAASDAVLSRNGQQLLLATQGGGLHTIDSRTRYLRHFSQASTAGGLLADDVRRIDRDEAGRLYFLCQQQDRLGLCRSGDDLQDWSTLMGIDRFAALDVEDPLSQISAAVVSGAELWIGTRAAGIGRYSPSTHAWSASLTATATGLLDNRIRDLVAGSNGTVWVATPVGINRVDQQGQTWERITVAEGLVGADVVRLRWHADALWYVTAAGGLGRFGQAGWETLIPESGWGQHGAEEVAEVAVDGGSQLWFATQRGEVGRYDPRRRNWFDAGAVVDAGRTTGLALSSGTNPVPWLATDKQLLRFDVGVDHPPRWQTVVAAGVDEIDAQGTAVVARLTPTTESPFGELRVSTDSSNWRTASGGRGISVGPRGIIAADEDGPGKQLWVGSENGLARYDTSLNAWSQELPLPSPASGGLLDLRLFDGAPVVLTEDREISRWVQPNAKWDRWLGGGKFEASESEIIAVTRDAAGHVWIGTQSKGLFEYDPQRHRWADRIAFPKAITELQASAGALWLLSDDIVHVVRADRSVQALTTPLPPVTAMAAAPQTAGVVLRGRAGQVILVNDDLQTQTLVGDPAVGLELSKVPVVGLLGDLVVCGGTKPHIYRTTTRDWQALPLGTVHEIVPALGDLWLRTSQELVRLGSDAKPEVVDAGGLVAQIAGTEDRVVALLHDGSIKLRMKGAKDWAVLKDVPLGPKPDVLSGVNWSATCVGEGLYLSGGEYGAVWYFGWDAQQWSPVLSGNAPLIGVQRVLSAGADVFALDAAGVLHAGRGGPAKLLPLAKDVLTAQDGGGAVVVTSRSGAAAVHQATGWQTIVGSALKEPMGEPKLSVTAAGGIVVADAVRSAWLAEGWSDWRAITSPSGAAFRISEFRASQNGLDVWAVTAEKQLYHLDRIAWEWKAALPENSVVESLTVVEGVQGCELWACLSDGSVQRVRGRQATLWSRPSAAPGRATEIVGMSAVPGGFLAAFGTGKLGFFDAVKRSWGEVGSPAGSQKLVELMTVGEAPDGCCLLRSQDGSVYRSPLQAAPTWTEVARGVSNWSRNGSVVFAIGGTNQQVLRIGVKGLAEVLLKVDGKIAANWGPLTAACELVSDTGRVWLVLGFSSQLAAYDAERHQWSTQSVSVRTLSPTLNGVLVQDAQGAVSVAKILAESLRLESVSKVARVATVSSAAADRRWLAVQEDGQVLVLEGSELKERLVGRAWSGNAVQTRLGEIVALGSSLLVLDSSGTLQAYDRQTRDWQRVASVTNGKRMAGGKTRAWVEVAVGAESQLLSLVVVDGKLATQKVADGVVRWQRGPAGVLAVVRQNGKQSEVLLRENGTSESVAVSVPVGPEENSVVGSWVVNNEVWLRTNTAGNLWNYRPATRQWSEFPLSPQAACDVVRFEGGVVRVQEADGELWRGEAAAADASGWRFSSEAKGVKAFDVDAKSVAWTTGQRVVVKDAKAQAAGAVRGERDFSSQAWMAPQDGVAWLAGHGETLAVVTQSGNAATYGLSARKWVQAPPVPVAVADLFAVGAEWCVVGTKDECTSLRAGQWKSALRSEKKWQDQQRQHAVDGSGRWWVNQVAPAKAVAPAKVGTIPAAAVRVLAAQSWLLLEAADGSLSQYDGETRDLTQIVAATAVGRRRSGLVTAGNSEFFVSDDQRKVAVVVGETGRLMPVTLPKALTDLAWTVLVHPRGLVVVGGDAVGVLLDGSDEPSELTADELTTLKAEGDAPEANRNQQSGRWRLVAAVAEVGVSGARLECQFGADWKPVSLDLARQRLGWDTVLGGLSVGGRVVLATASGVVVRPSDGRGLPQHYWPIDWSGGTSPGGRLWSLTDDRFLVRGYDGRKWVLTLEGVAKSSFETLSSSPSAWTIQRNAQSYELSAEFVPGNRVPVRFDQSGRLSCDVVSSVALKDDSVFVGTGAGLFEYSANLAEVRRVDNLGKCDVTTTADRKHLLVRRFGDGNVAVRDGMEWKTFSGNWEAVAAELGLLTRTAGSALSWELDLGRDRPAIRQVRYAGRGLSTDVTVASPGVLAAEATDGQRVFTLTADGFVSRTLKGDWLGINAVPDAVGLRWVQDAAGAWTLAVHGPDQAGWLLKNNALEVASNVAGLPTSARLEWDGLVWQVDPVEGGTRVALHSSEGKIEEVLDLKERGFVRDQVLAAGWDGTAAWIVSLVGIERHLLGSNNRPLVVPNPLADRSVRLVRGDIRLIASDGTQSLGLNADGSIKSVALNAEEKLRLTSLWRGNWWRVARPVDVASQTTGIETRTTQDTWIGGSLDTASGLSWDRLLGVGSTREQLLLATKDGDFVMPRDDKATRLPLSTWRAVARPADAGTASASGDPAELWTDAAGALWQRSESKWQRYRAETVRWESVATLPPAQSDERAVLTRSRNAAWIKAVVGVQFVETNADGQTATSTLAPDGVLSSAFVRAVLPGEKSMWLLTRQDLRQVELGTGMLMKAVRVDATDVIRSEFRAQGKDWFLRSQREATSDVWRLIDASWERLTKSPLGPFDPQPVEAQLGSFRFRKTGNISLTAEVRESVQSENWHPVMFEKSANRFEFQIARNAVANSTLALVQTAAGVTVWRATNGRWNLLSLRPDLKFVSAPVATRRLLGKSGGTGATYAEYDVTAGWSETTLTEAEKSVVAQSPRWSVSREASGLGRLAARTAGIAGAAGAKAPLVTLRLDPEGDFDFRRPSAIGVTKDSSVWTSSGTAMARFGSAPRIERTPLEVWADDAQPATAIGSVFVLDDAAHVSFGPVLKKFSGAQGWQTVADRTAVAEKQRQAVDGPFWNWKRDPNGALVAALKIVNQPFLPLRWDVALGRFDADRVQFAVATEDSVWLSHAAGVSRVARSSGRTTANVAAKLGPRLVCDRELKQWLVQSTDSPGQFSKLEFNPLTGGLESLSDDEPTVPSVTDRYVDRDFQFAATGMSWRGRKTGFISQHFAHDHFQSLTRMADHLVAITPVGLVVWRWNDPDLELVATIPPPMMNEEVLLEVVGADSIRAVGRKSSRGFEWRWPDGPWREVTDAEAERTLVESPRWTWSQTTAGDVRLLAKFAGETAVKPVLNGDGRFSFDDVVVPLCDGDDVWVACRDGVVRRSLADGEPQRWHRSGDFDGETKSLGSIVRLGRFRDEATPVASWAAADELAAAKLFALNADGEVWQLDSAGDGTVWRHVAINPWATEGGQRVLRDPLLEGVRTDAGTMALRYSRGTTPVPVLSGGRLTIDSVRDVAWTPDGTVILATRAGVVRATPETAAFLEMWTDSTEPGEIAAVRQVFYDETAKRLRAGRGDDVWHEFDSTTQRWSRLEAATEAATDRGDPLVKADLWTWSRTGNDLRVRLHRAGPEVGEWPLFFDGRFSFDVLRDFRLTAKSLVAVTPGGVVWLEPESMELQRIDRSTYDSETGQTVPLLTAERFAGDGSLTCFGESHVYRHDGERWARTIGKERLGEHRFTSGERQWQVLPLTEGTGGGFEVMLHNRQGLLVSQQRVLTGVPESALKRVVAGTDRLWLCLENGVYFVDAEE